MKRHVFFNHKEELWNTWSHAGGIILGVVFGVLALSFCLRRGDAVATGSIIIYLFGMLASYIFSTVYHSLSAWSVWKERLRRWDHAAIYWHIAGSYTPITLICLIDRGGWGWSLFIFVWTAAIIGTIVSFRRLRTHSNLETLCFVAMGLSILIAIEPLVDTLSTTSLLWIIAEGIFYITGAVFYSLNRRRFTHTVFHFFVLLGTICHMCALWGILTDTF